MGKIEGFNLLLIDPGVSLTTLNFAAGLVDRIPKRKYLYDKPNPIDPSERWRIGKFWEDKFDCTIFITPEEYDDLMAFLDLAHEGTNELRIDYTHGQNDSDAWVRKQFIITEIVKMPISPDDLHEFKTESGFTLKSVYTELPSVVGDGGVYADEIGYL